MHSPRPLRSIYSNRFLSWSLAAASAMVVLTHAPSPTASFAAPPFSTRSQMRSRGFFDSFSKQPAPPSQFISAPTPPLAQAKPVNATAAKAKQPPASRSHRLPSWDEATAFATSLQSSAGKVAAAVIDPTVPAKATRTANAREPTEPRQKSLGSSALAAQKVGSKQGPPQALAAPAPQSHRLNKLRVRIAQTLATYQRRPLNTAENTPWEIMHGFIAFGIPTKVRVGGPSGDPVNAIGWMNMGGRCRGQVMLAATGDRLTAMKGLGVQGHSAQYLAILAQCRVALNSPITIQSKAFTVADLVEEEKLSCKSKTELTFALIALAHYLPTDATWQSRDGQKWSLERLVSEEIEQPIRGAPCGGTHRLFGLAYGCQRRLKANGTLDGHYARADTFGRDYQKFVFSKLQNSDGSFSTEWFKYPADREDDIDRKVQTTGHILEWLVASLDQESLYSSKVLAAVEFLSTSLAKEPTRAWKIGPMCHALHALTIYQERVWGVVLPGGIAAFHGTMKAAPAAASIAKVPRSAQPPKDANQKTTR